MYRKQIISVLLIFGTTFISIGITACAPENTKAPAESVSTDGRAPVTPNAVSETTSVPSSEPLHGVTPGVKCQDLISRQALYEFNPNFSLVTGQSPVQPAVSSPYEKLGGITCNYMNQTSGEVIQISLAKITESAVDIPSSSFAKGGSPVSSLSTGETKSFFSQSNGNYVFRVVRGSYILVTTSTLLSTPEDNYKFISPALTKL